MARKKISPSDPDYFFYNVQSMSLSNLDSVKLLAKKMKVSESTIYRWNNLRVRPNNKHSIKLNNMFIGISKRKDIIGVRGEIILEGYDEETGEVKKFTIGDNKYRSSKELKRKIIKDKNAIKKNYPDFKVTGIKKNFGVDKYKKFKK